MRNRVRVQRNPDRKSPLRWVVTCNHCAGGTDDIFGLFGSRFGGKGNLGGTPDWQFAQDYAARHAAAHEATRCPTCQHVPARPLEEAKPA